jgi:choline/glycine/proline betaine transport protein
MSSLWQRSREHIHPVVFPVSAGVIVVFVVFGAVFAETADTVLNGILTALVDTFGWFMIGGVALMLLFCVFLVVGPYGKVRLGPDDSRPDYGYLTWFSMLFSAGMGIGLLFWGVAEPITHYANAPRFASETPEAAQDAMILTFHHYGLGPWAAYAVLGLSLAYFGFRHDLPLTIRSALYPLIGDRIHGWQGNLIDTLAIFGTMFGVATSLGLGVLQVNAGLNSVFGVPQNPTVQVILIAAITLVATISVFTGLDKGIRRLSQLNIGIATVLLLFVAVLGPTVLLFGAYLENIGAYVTNFVNTLFWTGTYEDADGWLGSWTIFYWAWWISWSPFVGMFVARISRGRTIREFILGVLLVPSLVSFLWFTVMGNTAIDIQESGATDLIGPTNEDPALAMFAMLDAFPLASITSVLAIVVVTLFFVTSSDSGSFVIDMIASGGNPDPPKPQRIFWATTEGVVAAVLLGAGGLTALQAGAVSTGLPFTAVLIVVVIGLVKGLKSELSDTPMEDVPAQSMFDKGSAEDDPAAVPTGKGTDPATGGSAERAAERATTARDAAERAADRAAAERAAAERAAKQ